MESTPGYDKEAEGLFSKRSSSNILSDPRILQHLRIVAQEAHRESLDEVPENDDEVESENQTRELYEKISSYNKRNQLGAFKILAKENLNYEGALRFYFEDGGEELTKAVRLTNLTTVKELLPTLVEKFKPGLENELVEFSKLYAVQEQDEICLDQTDWPLGIALNATKALRFILRIKNPGTSQDENRNTNKISATNGRLSTDGAAPPVVTFQEMEKRPMNKLNDFMYAGRDKSIKMTTNIGAKYDQNNSPKTKNKVKGRSLGTVLKLPKKGRTLERGVELSTSNVAPGILKVFGENISQDSTYKSVKATSGSSADVIIKQALGKHKLDMADPRGFVLCDVIGHFKKKSSENVEQGKLDKSGEMEWVAEYVRVVGDKEKPLVLQSLWKPARNKSRRFELRRRSTIDDEMLKDGTNGIVRKKGTAYTPPDLSALSNQLSINSAEFSDSEKSVTTIESPRQRSVINSDSISQSNLTFNMSTAIDVPYILLLKGSGILEDYLLHRLDEDALIIGKPTIGQKHPDIPLYSEDIRSEHCQIYKRLSGDNESTSEYDDGMDQVFIEPFMDSVVLVNGKLLTEAVMLCPGDLVQIGTHYIFLYKDPVRVSDVNLTFDWMPMANSHVNGFDRDLESKAKVIEMQEVTRNANHLSMSYDLDEEDKMLEFIASICESVKDGDFELVASYLFILSVEHSATYHGDIDTRRLILKITNIIQAVAWDKTKGITETNVEGEMDPLKSLNEIIPDLKLILFWMSNALEMLHFLQDNLPVYLPNPYPMSAASSNDPEEEALANSDEELLNVLEEVAMFTFQQTVYHLTKVLYVALPLILDTNPFQKLEDDDSRNGDVLEGAEIVVEIFQTVYNLITSFHVHHQIVRQLFAYLFFFTNASLFNTLMDRGAGGKFYRWAKGAQIRGNLDLLEGWATDVGLQEEATDYLRRLSSAADILATPKVQLLQSSWQNLRRDFPILNAAQLHKILTEYQVGAGKNRPANWRPTPEEVDSALKDEEILESFSSHPPFLFPTSDYVLDLEAEPPHPVVIKALDALRSSFHPNKESSQLDTKSPHVLIHAPSSDMADSSSQGSSSVKSSPPPSVITSSHMHTHKFSSSDPTLNHIAGKGQNSRLKNEVAISKSASLNNLSSRTYSLKARRSNSGRTRVKEEVIPPTNKAGKNDALEDWEGYRNVNDGQDDVFVVELDKGDSGIGVGLIDGLFTPLKSNGIYVRTLLSSGPASQDGRLKLGDRILAVNGTSLVGADYQSAMKLIRNAGNHLTFLVAKSDRHVAMKITASTC